MSIKFQYASSHATNYVTVKCIITERAMIADAKRQTWMKCAFKIVGFAHSVVRRMQANTFVAPRNKGEQQRASQCSRHVSWICYYGSSKMWNAFKLDHYRIIVSYHYDDIFDLSFISDQKQYLTYRNSTSAELIFNSQMNSILLAFNFSQFDDIHFSISATRQKSSRCHLQCLCHITGIGLQLCMSSAQVQM